MSPASTEAGARNEVPPIQRYRVVLSQVLAATAKNLLLLDLGMTLAFPTIVIPSLLDDTDTRGLKFNKEQASWFGSVLYICQPLGSILSGVLLEPLGRKTSMMVVNIPHIVGWLLLYFTRSYSLLYLAVVLLGLGVGFMEAPIITYIGEICEPKLRGILISYSNLFATFGMSLVYLLATMVHWRVAAAISTLVPLITVLAISQVPETPLWLLSRGRKDEAEKALRWLRGWAGAQHVAKEFKELQNYSQSTKLTALQASSTAPAAGGYSNAVFTLEAQDNTEPHQGVDAPKKVEASERPEPEVEPKLNLVEFVKDFLRPQMLKPLGLILGFFFFSNTTGSTATRPYMVKLGQEFRFPMDPYKANVVFGGLGFAASLVCMMTVAKLGRRMIALSSMAVSAGSGLLLGLSQRHPMPDLLGPWFAFFMFVLLTFSTYYGCGGLVWTMVSEVFPFRGRSLASGISAAWSYVLSFVVTKTFLSLETNLGLEGVFYLYGILSALGFVFLYYQLPETEGRSLEDIETSYAKS